MKRQRAQLSGHGPCVVRPAPGARAGGARGTRAARAATLMHGAQLAPFDGRLRRGRHAMVTTVVGACPTSTRIGNSKFRKNESDGSCSGANSTRRNRYGPSQRRSRRGSRARARARRTTAPCAQPVVAIVRRPQNTTSARSAACAAARSVAMASGPIWPSAGRNVTHGALAAATPVLSAAPMPRLRAWLRTRCAQPASARAASADGRVGRAVVDEDHLGLGS